MEEENNEMYDESYELPEEKELLFDSESNEVIEKEELSVFQQIKLIAEQNGYGDEIRKPRSGCKKCYGRGFIGREAKSQTPIPCNCIYIPKSPIEKMNESLTDSRLGAQPKPSRKQRREQKRKMLKYIAKNKKKIISDVNKNNDETIEQ